MYCKKVNKDKRGEMITFLKNHFRYYTANSWNKASSYANNIKLYNIGKPADIDEQTFWQVFGITEWQQKLSELLEDFGRRYNWNWQAGINGRNGGYVVLYKGGIQPSGYKSYCSHCGQKNYKQVPEGEIGICGRCEAKARVNYEQRHMQIFTLPGKGIDENESFSDWSSSQIRERVELVQDFDKLCSKIVREYLQICRNYKVTEQEILVPETVKVLKPI
jgi:hypothetical protein